MPDILPLLLCLQPALSKTTCRQLARIVEAVLAMTGRVTQKGISRWTEPGGSYRTIQRFFQTPIDWLALNWGFFAAFVCDRAGVYLLVGDETVVSKAGKKTFGLDRFFSSLCDRAIPSVACFSLALVHVGRRQAYSLSNEQVVRSEQEKQQARERKQQRPACTKKKTAKKRPGRPKGSKNRDKAAVTFSAELVRIKAHAQKALQWIRKRMWVSHLALDGHFGNNASCQMARQLDLHLVSKLRADAALYAEPTPAQRQAQPRRKYGDRMDMSGLPSVWLRASQTQDGYQTEVYQVRCLHKQFAHKLNVVILRKTHLSSGRVGHVLLFSTDLFLTAATIIDYYSLRFQIEFTFRDAKQYFGLEDFMSVTPVAVTNAIGLSLFLVNLSAYLLEPLRLYAPGAGIADLKSWYRGRFYACFVLKLLPERPETIVWDALVEQICRLGCVHPASPTAAELEMAA
jgi:putative transposase